MNEYQINDRDLFIQCNVSVTIELMGSVRVVTPEGSREEESPQLGPEDRVEVLVPDPVEDARKIIISSRSTSGWSFAFQRYSDEHGWGPDEQAPVSTSSAPTKWRVHASRGDDNFYSAPFHIDAVASEHPRPEGPR